MRFFHRKNAKSEFIIDLAKVVAITVKEVSFTENSGIFRQVIALISGKEFIVDENDTDLSTYNELKEAWLQLHFNKNGEDVHNGKVKQKVVLVNPRFPESKVNDLLYAGWRIKQCERISDESIMFILESISKD